MCMNRVNSGKTKGIQIPMLILSQAEEGYGSSEGAETTKVSPNNNPSHERPGLDKLFLNHYIHLGGHMPKGRSWTTEETKWLRENYEMLGADRCAYRLKRSPTAIRHQASRLGLIRRGMGREARVVIIDGYIWISQGNEGIKTNRFPIHRRIKEMEIGRKLSSDEIVHHKDGNKMNNHPDNLEITNRSEHMRKHEKIRNEKGQFTSHEIVRPSGKPEEMRDKEPS